MKSVRCSIIVAFDDLVVGSDHPGIDDVKLRLVGLSHRIQNFSDITV